MKNRPCLSKEDYNEILTRAKCKEVFVIDGENDVSKTTFSKELHSNFISKNNLIHLDEFLKNKDGGFLDRLDYEKIRKIYKASPGTIIEGIMALNVMDEIESEPYLNPTILIYVCSEVWIEKWKYWGNRSIHDIIQEAGEKMFIVDSKLDLNLQDLRAGGVVHAPIDSVKTVGLPMDRFNFDLYSYTAIRQPWKKADFILVKNTDMSVDAPYLKILHDR